MALSAKQLARLNKMSITVLRGELRKSEESMAAHNRHNSSAHQDIAADLEVYADAVRAEIEKREAAGKGK